MKNVSGTPAWRNTLLCIDDHPIYCDGLTLALSRHLPSVRVLVAHAGAEAYRLLETTDIDLVLSDHRLPGEDGIEVLRQIGEQAPSVARGMLCADVSPRLVAQARAIGAIACLSKDRDVASIATVLEGLFNGESIFDAEAVEQDFVELTEHRKRIIALAALGRSNKEIARELGIVERTVKDHWTQIFRRLRVSNRVQAIQRAREYGFIS